MSIPKIIHLIWLGGELPDKYRKLLNRIKKINHDYEIKEWNDFNINFELKNKDLIDKIDNLGGKSDIVRFEVLYKYGGIYMDYDFLQIKKFDELLDYDFFAGAGVPGEVWNSIIGSTKNNEIVKYFLENLINSPIGKHDVNAVMNNTGPYYLQKVVLDNNWKCNYKILNKNYFYPFLATERETVKDLSDDKLKIVESYKTEETITIHIHTTSWQIWEDSNFIQNNNIDWILTDKKSANESWKPVHDDLAKLIKSNLYDPKLAAEVGCAYGSNAYNLLEKFKDLRLYLIDPYIEYSDGLDGDLFSNNTKSENGDYLYNFTKNRIKKQFNNRSLFLRETTNTVSHKINDDSLDFVFIDSNHMYEWTLKDLVNMYPKVKQSGIVAGDDYNLTNDRWFNVKKAVDYFCMKRNIKLNVTNNIWWFKK